MPATPILVLPTLGESVNDPAPEIDAAGAARLRVVGELDIATAPQLARTLHHALATARSVVLDLRGLMFIDSFGVHTLVDATASAQQAGRRLVVVAGPQVERIVKLTGVEGRIEIASELIS